MQNQISALLYAMVLNLVIMAAVLPAVMGRVNAPARHAQISVALQAAGWGLLLLSGYNEAGGWLDRSLSTLAIASLAFSLVLMGTAFKLWCGRPASARLPILLAAVIPVGYGAGFSNYAFRVGWANGLLAVLMLGVVAILLRRPKEPVGRWRWVVVASFATQSVVTAWRGVLGGWFPEDYPAFLTPHPVNYAFVLVANVTAVLSLVGILLAHRDEAARALERLASIDDLTGVFNRRAWLAHSATEFAVGSRYGHSMAVLMIDIDHFKQVNDTRGHEVGDRALRFIATALQSAVRPGDLVGRYGGEEFAVLINHANEGAASAFDLRMRQHLAEAAQRELGFGITYSAGIAMRTSENDTLEAMLRRADATMYSAKAQGRARTLDHTGVQLHPPQEPAR